MILFHLLRLAQAKAREAIKRRTRSRHWGAFSDWFIAENSLCEGCGTHRHLQVHHVKDFARNPHLELDWSNLSALCMDERECHLRLGHGGNFRFSNPGLRADLEELRAHPDRRPEVERRARLARR